MKWSDVVMNTLYTNNHKLAMVMVAMWGAVAEAHNDALTSNLSMNQTTPISIANSLDWAGVPVNTFALEIISK